MGKPASRAAALPSLTGLLILLALAFPAGSHAQPETAAGPRTAGDDDAAFAPNHRPRLTATRAAGPIAVDGVLDDRGWRGAARADGFCEHSPGDQVRPPVETEAYLTYDDEHLYVAFVCHDDPAQVRASLTERDRIWQDDYVILLIDTYGDQSAAYEIAANPYGVQGDLLWSPTVGEDLSYDLIFAAAGRVHDDGYTVEMAVPFASLRFPERPVQEWRVDFWRNHPRQVRGQYGWAGYDRDESCWPCQWGAVGGIEGVRPGRGLGLMPAFVASQASARRDSGEFASGPLDGQASLGVRYDLGSTLSAEGTYNPDFSQVEADVAQVDVNTTFALFFPERRPFFQEGSDLFQTYFNVFYSRSINDPELAAKTTARPGRTSVAYLVARDEHTPFILPFAEGSEILAAGRSTVNVLRARHSLGDQSHLGLIATDRRLDGGGSGTVVGLDGRFRLDQNHQLEWQALATRTAEPDDPALTAGLDSLVFGDDRFTSAFDGETFRGHGLHASLEREGRHLSYDLNYWERSPTFRTDNGFEPRNDQRFGTVNGGYTIWFDDAVLDWLQPSFQVARMWNFDGVRKDEWVRGGLSGRLKLAQTNLSAGYMRSNELFGGVQFDGIFEWEAEFSSIPADWLRLGASWAAGHRIARDDLLMGRERRIDAWLDLKPLDPVLVETQLDWIRSDAVDTGAALFEGYVARAKLSLQLTRGWSTRLVAQYNEFYGIWELDPLITYRLNPFSIFYVGSTRDWTSLPGRQDGPQRWRLTDRQYFLKIQYLFQA